MKYLMLAVIAAAAVGLPTAHAADKKPAPEMAQMDAFAGSWTCKGVQHDTVFGSAHPIETAVTGRSELGGFWMTARFVEKKTRANATPTSGAFQYGFDPGAKVFIANWVDNHGGYGRQTTRGWEGDTLVLLGDYVATGQKLAARDTFKKIPARSWSHVFELQVQGNWVTVLDETCRH